MSYEIGGRESGVVVFNENDEVRVNDDAVLAPEAVRGEVGTIMRINRFLSESTQISESLVAVDRYQQPETDRTCRLKISELLMEKLQSPRIISGVKYEPNRSLSTLRGQQ